jgi:dTDP-4-amino-4,6-dideoxygalactose transaminase
MTDSSARHIPFVDLAAQYAKLKPEMDDAIAAVLKSRAFIQGPFVSKFEGEFSSKLGAAFGLGCANGTAAISLALEALGIARGDEVITVAHTFIATAEAICHVGAIPVFVDIDPLSYNMDPAAFDAAITPRTRAVIPVHLYGTPCDLDPIMRIASKHGIKVVEDAAQAHLATYRGRYAGAIGDCGTFSFYPGKNLGAYGDAGFVTCRDANVAKTLGKLRDHGRLAKYEHDMVGYNQRMDGLQAAVLSVKLRHLDHWTEARRRTAARYDARLRQAGFKTIEPPPMSVSSYHLYVVEVSNRDETIRSLLDKGIETGIHYPVPLHIQPALARYRDKLLPVTERVASRVLSLPMCAELSEDAAEEVCATFLRQAMP